jgi:hypothetical protein
MAHGSWRKAGVLGLSDTGSNTLSRSQEISAPEQHPASASNRDQVPAIVIRLTRPAALQDNETDARKRAFTKAELDPAGPGLTVECGRLSLTPVLCQAD